MNFTNVDLPVPVKRSQQYKYKVHDSCIWLRQFSIQHSIYQLVSMGFISPFHINSSFSKTTFIGFSWAVGII